MLLRAGVAEMWLRYLLSFGVAYVIFLFLLWLWLRTRTDQYSELVDVAGALPSGDLIEVALPSGPDTPAIVYTGMGGMFDGGGASGSYETTSAAIPAASEGGAIADNALGTVAEADEFAIPLAVILVIATIVFSSLFMTHSAPVLFAELVVDGCYPQVCSAGCAGLERGIGLKRHFAIPRCRLR